MNDVVAFKCQSVHFVYLCISIEREIVLRFSSDSGIKYFWCKQIFTRLYSKCTVHRRIKLEMSAESVVRHLILVFLSCF